MDYAVVSIVVTAAASNLYCGNYHTSAKEHETNSRSLSALIPHLLGAVMAMLVLRLATLPKLVFVHSSENEFAIIPPNFVK